MIIARQMNILRTFVDIRKHMSSSKLQSVCEICDKVKIFVLTFDPLFFAICVCSSRVSCKDDLLYVENL